MSVAFLCLGLEVWWLFYREDTEVQLFALIYTVIEVKLRPAEAS